jgi:hypothetical protein
MHPRGRSARQRAAGQAVRLAEDRTAPQFCFAPAGAGAAGGPQAGASEPVNGHVDGYQWGGYAVTEAEYGSEINGVTGSWTVPSHSSAPEPSGESTWVGIGGGAGGEKSGWGLIQAGTSMFYNRGYQSWWEFLGSSGCVYPPNFCGQYSSVNAIYAGDQVIATVWWDTTTTATFLLMTNSGGGINGSGPNWDITDFPTGGIPYDHTSAEWVNENPWNETTPYGGIQNQQYDYDDPGTVHFSGQGLTSSFAGQGSFTSPFAGKYQAEIMGAPGAPAPTGTSCAPDFIDNYVLSYPADPVNTSGGGSSEIVTCNDPPYDSDTGL